MESDSPRPTEPKGPQVWQETYPTQDGCRQTPQFRHQYIHSYTLAAKKGKKLLPYIFKTIVSKLFWPSDAILMA